MRAVASLLACALLTAVLALARPAVAAEEAAFEVRIEAPESLRALLEAHVEISRWRTHERMNAEEFRRLYRAAPKEIADLLATQGYYRPKIESSLDEREGRLGARFVVDPGQAVSVASVSIQFAGALPQQDADAAQKMERLRLAWPLGVGTVFRHEDWEGGKRALLRSLALDRYPLATIAKSEALVDPDERTAQLTVVVDTGPSVRFGQVEIEGLSIYPRSVVENLNPIRVGEPYSLLQLREYQTRLLESGYFTSVTVDARPLPDGTAPVRVWVEERETRRIAFGVGYSTDAGARFQAEYRQLNFLQRALQLGARIKTEERAQSVGADLFFPTTADGYRDRLVAVAAHTDIQGTQTDKVTLTAGRTRRRGDIESDISISYITEEERVAGFADDSRQAIAGNWSYTLRRTNHPLFPDQGYLLNVQVGGAPGILVAERSFLRLYGRTAFYLKMGDAGLVTLRGELGWVRAHGTSGIPSDYLFRTGGDQTVRGYAFQSLGVRKGDGVTGGRALGVASAEYTHWVREDWGVAVFVDAGNATEDFRDFSIKTGAGIGARWRSPVGPLNLDVAYGQDEGSLRLHFSVGLAF
jgi:translocation and assembly module TamA